MAHISIHSVPGNIQSLPAAVVASILDVPLALTPPEPAPRKTPATSHYLSPFSNDFSVTVKGIPEFSLQEQVAAARYIVTTCSKELAQSLLPDEQLTARIGVEAWLEWEEYTLRPSVLHALRTKTAIPEASFLHIEQAVGSTGFVTGDRLTLADVATWTTLHLVYGPGGLRAGDEAGPASSYYRKLGAEAAFSGAVAVALAGSAPDSFARLAASAKQEGAAPAASSAKLAPSASNKGGASSSIASENAPGASKLPSAAAGSSKSARAAAKVPEAAPDLGADGRPFSGVESFDARSVRLPVPGRRNIMVTSALPYVNNVPHLGNIIGCVLSADVYARFCRRRGHNVIYMCGTDEYGTATETKAMEEGITPREICDKYHAIHKEIYEWFDIDFDKFGRTSTPQQTDICQAIFQSLHKRGQLKEDTMEQLFCDTCSRFLADRFVEGGCPTPGCGYEDARGDQCDKCGKLLNPVDLINPRCKICRSPPRVRQTEHLFLDLPGLKDRLVEYVNATSVAGGWSQNSVQTTNAWIRDGLKARCITRDLKWGVQVPLEKYKDKVFYVWFDAPIGYISITANYTDEWAQWWQSPKDVELVQFMGKDNVPFHTVIFPCTLLGTEEPWTLMRTISVCEYLNYEAGKFSKSRGVGVFGNDAKTTSIPVEVWRYYLLTNRPEVSDTQFTWSDLQAKQNNELLKNLGNFVNRVMAFIAKPAGEGFACELPAAAGAEDHQLSVRDLVVEYVDCMEKVKLKAGLRTAMQVSSLGNLYLQESQFWKLFKSDVASCAVVMRTSCGLLSQMNLPRSALRLSDEHGDVDATARPWDLLPAQHKIGTPFPIFTEMKDAEVEEYRQKFSGSQADRKKVEDDLAAATAANGGVPPAGIPASAAAPAADKKAAASSADKKVGKKEKGADKKSAAAEGGAAKKAAPDKGAAELPVDVSRLDIRVGVIRSVKKHPDADSLYVEEIDCGEASLRTVVSGLVKFVPIEQMQDRRVCVLCNLKPASMRGVKSHAMVLAASNADHTQVELVSPPEGAAIGERITVPRFPGQPDEQLNPKKKVWEAVQPDLKTGEDLIASYKGAPFTTSAGVCTVASLSGASIA
eukprot:jgi/Mesen1/8597/ME000005S08567